MEDKEQPVGREPRENEYRSKPPTLETTAEYRAWAEEAANKTKADDRASE